MISSIVILITNDRDIALAGVIERFPVPFDREEYGKQWNTTLRSKREKRKMVISSEDGIFLT